MRSTETLKYGRRFAWCTRLFVFTMLVHEVRADGEIGAVGHLEPSSSIIDLIGTPGTRISEILAIEGEKVNKGDTLLRFHNHDLLKAQLDLASHELSLLEKTRDIKLALQEHALHSAELSRERTEQKLREQRQLGELASTKRQLTDLEDLALDARRLVEKEEMVYDQLRVTLNAEILKAQAQLALALARYEDSYLSAPISGTVLAVRKQVGENVGVGDQSDAGYIRAEVTLRLGDLSQMYVVCEVYEGDLLRIRKGMNAKVASSALPKAITGKVERISNEVDTSSRLASVWIRLDDSDLASRFVGMEVQVTILP